MRFLPILLISGILVGLRADTKRTSDCSFRNIRVDPIAPDRKDTYVGKGNEIQVEFHNESSGDAVRVFPEPPLKVRQLTSGKTCDIDGGIWSRDAVYLSSDEKTLIVLEFSGGSNDLISYNTSSCKQQGDIDVSGARWKISGERLVIGKQCASNEVETCAKKKTVLLEKLCVLSREGKGK